MHSIAGKLNLDKRYVKTLLVFGIPLLIGGLAGIANEMLDRQLLKYLLPEESWAEGVGVYGAVYKISIFLILFNQAFRYAAEPFFLRNAKTAEGPKRMAKVMEGFAWVMSVGFVLIIAGLDFLKFFIAVQSFSSWFQKWSSFAFLGLRALNLNHF